MTDEEKKAIEHFNDLNHLYEIGVDTLKYTESEYDNSEILLNLIEKQEKGIRDNYFLYIKEKNNYDKLLVLYEKQQKEIEDLHLAWDYYKNSYENSIPKSKIQEKIEEIMKRANEASKNIENVMFYQGYYIALEKLLEEE